MSTIRYDFEPGYCGEIIQADGRVLCTFSDEPDKETASRLVACWNACETVSTEDLEIISDADENFSIVRNRFVAQRDKLIAATEEVLRISDRKHEAWDKVKAMIAEIKQ